MVNHARRLNLTFRALADPTRRDLLSALMRGEASVSELAQPHRMSLPAVMKHLRVLRRAGLVRQHKVGRLQRCALRAAPLQDAEQWIARYRMFWEAHLDSLDRYLAGSHAPASEQAHQPKETVQWPKSKRRPR
jgi:DNA-binding transcriptional ArsR family regulator